MGELIADLGGEVRSPGYFRRPAHRTDAKTKQEASADEPTQCTTQKVARPASTSGTGRNISSVTRDHDRNSSTHDITNQRLCRANVPARTGNYHLRELGPSPGLCGSSLVGSKSNQHSSRQNWITASSNLVNPWLKPGASQTSLKHQGTVLDSLA